MAQSDTTIVTQGDSVQLDGFDAPVHYFGKDSTIFDLENDWVYLYGDGSFVQYKDLELKGAKIRFSI